MNEQIEKALEYIIKRKKLIGKKIDKDQQSLELFGEYQSSDKQWFGWCDEFDILSFIEKALKQYEELTRKKFIDELLSPTIKDFNYKPPKVDEIVISIDRKRIEEKYPSLRGSFDFSDLLHKVIEDYEKKHRKI